MSHTNNNYICNFSMKAKKLIVRESMNDTESEYSSSRFACELKGTLLQMQENKLSLDDFPSVLPMPVQHTESVGRSKVAKSARGDTTPSRFRKNNGDSSAGGQKLFGARQIVFIAGGACYSELRSARDVMDASGYETMLGCTHLVNPSDFVKGLATL